MIKHIEFRLFHVANPSITDEVTPLFSMLSSSLGGDKKYVESRVMNLKDSDPSDKDLLGYFAKTNEYIYGVIMRIAYAKDVQELPENFDKIENIDIEKILEEAEQKGSEKMVCKSMYHFLIIGDYLITDLPKSRPITCFQDYINWLLSMSGDKEFSINPAIEKDKIKLNQIKKVIFKDAFVPFVEEKKSAIRLRVDKFINSLIEGDDLTMKDLHDKHIVSATLTVCFNRPKKMTTSEYENYLSAILKTSDKPDNIVFEVNGKKRLNGNHLLFSRSKNLENEPILKDADYIAAMKEVKQEYETVLKK